MKVFLSKFIPLRILVVDHDYDIRETFCYFLKQFGHEVVSSKSTLRALGIARVLEPHIIYTSLIFEELNGFEFCEHLRKSKETIESLIVASSGLSFAGSKDLAKSAGFDYYFIKPVSFDSIEETLKIFTGQFPVKSIWPRRYNK